MVHDMTSATMHFELHGTGPRNVLFLHGNTASSRMFQPVLEFWEKDFTILLPDFMGHGQSGRLPDLDDDLWFSQALQTASLLDGLGWRDVGVVGTSGGALVALNLALERSDLVSRVVADSFEGERALDIVAESIEAEREASKQDPDSVAFWRDCHGQDWEHVVDCDTRAMLRHHATIGRFFQKPLEDLERPALLTASLKDEFAQFVDFHHVYGDMCARIPTASVYLFEQGSHPAMLSNGAEFARIAGAFLLG